MKERQDTQYTVLSVDDGEYGSTDVNDSCQVVMGRLETIWDSVN